MINMNEKYVCEKNQCTSCTACISICPRNCITLKKDFFATNALIDESKCIHCRLCEKACQQVTFHKEGLQVPKVAYAAKGLPEEDYKHSSSGGLATLLAKQILRKGGAVVGSAYVDKTIKHILVEKEADLPLLQGSKYVKSDLNDLYRIVESKLKEKPVLFTGTPCQVYGLKAYLFLKGKKLLENLYTIDLICHGTPQQSILQKYLDENVHSDIKTLEFRNKGKYALLINHNYKYSRVCDPYTLSFLSVISFTENCYSCKFATASRIGDITLGDAWGYEKNGYSAVIVNSAKGEKLFEEVSSSLVKEDTTIEKLAEHNGQLKQPSSRPEKRDKFIANFRKKSFRSLCWKIYPKAMLKQIVKKVLVTFHLIN